jgi:hypothetical protein
VLNAPTETTAAPRTAPRQPQARDANQRPDDFSSLIDDNAAAKADPSKSREPDASLRSAGSQRSRDSRDRDTDRARDNGPSSISTEPSSQDQSPATDAKISSDHPVKRGKPVSDTDDPLHATASGAALEDAVNLVPTAIPDNPALPAAAIAAAIVAPVPVVAAPVAPSPAVPAAPLAIAAAAIAAAKLATSKPAAPSDTSELGAPADPNAEASAAQSALPGGAASIAMATTTVDEATTETAAASPAPAPELQFETGVTVPGEPKPAVAQQPQAPSTASTTSAEIKAGSAAHLTDAKTKVGTDDAPAAATPASPTTHDHRAAAATPVSTTDLTPPSGTPAIPQQTTIPPTANAVPAATALNPTAAMPTPVPLGGLAIELAAKARGGASRFEIRLDPADFGRIDVRIDVDRQGQVTSHLTVEKPETLAMLKQDAPQLQRALNDAGLRTNDGALQFSLGDQSQPRQNTDNTERQAQRLIVRDDETIAPMTPVRSYGRMFAARGGVDISV